MVKTKGSIDRQRRKRRSDIGKRRKMYKGKPTKKKRKKQGRLVLYVSKRKKGDPIRVWFWERKLMSYDGYLRWSRKIRPYLTKTITKFVDKPIRVDPSEISTPEKLGELAIDVIQYPGTFLLMMSTHAKNSYRVSYKKKAVIKITETEDQLYAKVFDYSNLKRYWFFRE